MRAFFATPKKLEKNRKSFKKGIDKGKVKWYNIRAAAKTAVHRSLKIEQQRESTKQGLCRDIQTVCEYDLAILKENTTQNKSKRANQARKIGSHPEDVF